MLRKIRFRLQTLLLAVALASVPLWINARPPQLEWSPDKGEEGYMLHAVRGWPFHYLDVYEEVSDPLGRIRDGWPEGSTAPSVSHVSKLIADLTAGLIFVFGSLWLVQRVKRLMIEFRRGYRGILGASPEAAARGVRFRVIPATLMSLLGIAGLATAGCSLVVSVWEWLDFTMSLSFSHFGFYFYPALRYAFSESCLGIASSLFWLRGAKACWASDTRRTAVYALLGAMTALLLAGLLSGDAYNSWSNYGWPLKWLDG